MKKIVYLLVLCLSLSIIYSQANAITPDAKKDAGYITLNKSVEKEVDPNKASIGFAIENTAENAKKAVEENNIIANKIMDALKQIAQTSGDIIRTNNFDVRPNYEYSNNKRVLRNYTAVNSVTVETKDIQKITEYINKAIANGANRTNSLSYSYENDRSVCNDLYPEIIKDLRAQADSIAKAAGTSIDGVKQINVSCGSNFSMRNKFYAGLADGAIAESAASTPVEPGKIKIIVSVNADFYVK